MTEKRTSARRAAGVGEAKKPSIAGRLRGRAANAESSENSSAKSSAKAEGGASQAASPAIGASDAAKLAALTAVRARARADSGDIAKRPDLAAFPVDETYDPGCTRCPRLASFLAESHAKYPSYWCRPVPAFGAPEPRIVLVGLAPGMQGANRTARPFTGDYAGILLYQTLYELGLASQPTSVSYDDPLKLINTRIINAVKCVPPENKPLPDEIRTCNQFLKAEVARLTSAKVFVALGRVAHDAILSAMDLKRSRFTFGHAAEHPLGQTRHLIDSYHCSRYNTQTRRLTPEMFKAVLSRACQLAQV
jgi:uracil-DNA glycosylase family 4